MLKRGGDALSSVKDARGATFLDLDEDVSPWLSFLSLSRLRIWKMKSRFWNGFTNYAIGNA